MRIIAWISRDSGPAYHRIILPLLRMHDVDTYITNNHLPAEDFDKGCEVFLFNRILPPGALDHVLNMQKIYGFKIVCDIDDYWILGNGHPLQEHYIQENFAAAQIRHIKAADYITCTHSRLRQLIYHYNRNVEVFPNAIPNSGQYSEVERTPFERIRFFWQGSDTHVQDIAILRHPLEKLGSLAKNDIAMVMAGYSGSKTWERMIRDYTADMKHEYIVHGAALYTEYYKFYKDADVCLVPLVKSTFNSMKSNLKVLEAAHLAIPVIASQVHPYLDMPLFYCKRGEDWIKNITVLTKSESARIEGGLSLQDFCKEHFNFEEINQHRKEFFESII